MTTTLSAETILLPCGCPAIEVRDTGGLHLDTCPRGPFGQVHGPPTAPHIVYHDGGRYEAGFKGETRDCVTRAFATVTHRPYREIYDLVNDLAARERPRGKRRRSAARTGVHRRTIHRVAAALDMTWTPTMAIGSGTLIHVRTDELPPEGRHVLNLSKHLAAWIDGELWDTHDPSRDGTRAVYGYWSVT